MKKYNSKNKQADTSELSPASSRKKTQEEITLGIRNNRPESLIQRKINELELKRSGQVPTLVPSNGTFQRRQIFNSHGGLVVETDNKSIDELRMIAEFLTRQNEHLAAQEVMQVIFDRDDTESSASSSDD